MALILKLPPKTKPVPVLHTSAKPEPVKHAALERSKLAVMDIPLDLIDDAEINPNEMSEATFDKLVEKVREEGGVDEPVHVVPTANGRYAMVSGHHRKKAQLVAGFATIPGIVKEGWDEDKAEIELMARNMIKGKTNPEQFTKLFDKLMKKGYNKELIKSQMAFTEKDAFEKVYKSVSDSLPPEKRKKLAEAKEKITSVDSLSSVLNEVFKENGTELDHGFMVFAYGGKNNHFIQIDKPLEDQVVALEKHCMDNGLHIREVMKHIIKSADLSKLPASAKLEPTQE